MQNHNLKRVHKNKKHKTVGRGSKRGKTAGRGTKGQNARAGHKKRPEIRDFIKRIPKLRGRGKNSNISIQEKPFALNLGDLNPVYKNGDTISPGTLVEKGLARRFSGKLPKIKILASGEFDKKITVKDCDISGTAKLVIEKLGGNILVG